MAAACVEMLRFKSSLHLALILIVTSACDAHPPLVNNFVEDTPSPGTQEWLSDVFFRENPNAADYRLIKVNSRQILNDIDRIRLTLLNGEIVTATKVSSDVYDGSIRWKGAVDGAAESDVSILATNNPYLKGHIVIGDRVELFAHAVPGADSIMYRVNLPDRSLSLQADILPDADPANIPGVAWRGLLNALPLSAYRITKFDLDTWRRKTEELRQSGTTVMHFFDDTPYRIESAPYDGDSMPKPYRWQIAGSSQSTVGLRTGIGPGLRGYVQSRETGYVKVTPLADTVFYIVWVMHPEFNKAID